MDYSPTFCFAGFNSKGENFNKKEEKKEQRTKYRRGAMSRQKTACHKRTWEECNKSVKTKKDNVTPQEYPIILLYILGIN